MEVTELGIVTDTRLLQSENAEFLIWVTELGIVIELPLPMYPIKVSILELENTKSPSIIPFIEYAPHGAPVAVP